MVRAAPRLFLPPALPLVVPVIATAPVPLAKLVVSRTTDAPVPNACQFVPSALSTPPSIDLLVVPEVVLVVSTVSICAPALFPTWNRLALSNPLPACKSMFLVEDVVMIEAGVDDVLL